MRSYGHKYPKILKDFQVVTGEVAGGHWDKNSRTVVFHNNPGETFDLNYVYVKI